MAAKTDFTPEEWASIRSAPHLVAAVMMLAGNSGITGTFRESFAVAQSLYGGLSSGNPLIREIVAPEEAKAAQEQLRSQISFGQPPEQIQQKLRTMATEQLDKAIATLTAKGTPQDVSDYKRFVYEVANKVANASKEGAFLGFGGERVSDAEEALLKELGGKLQVA